MCLAKVNKSKPKEKTGTGYKIFRNTIFSNVFTSFLQEGERYRLGEWYEANGMYLSASDGKIYDCGFHIYIRKNVPKLRRQLDAAWGLCSYHVFAEVEYQDARAKGHQDRIPVVVAKKMRILRVVANFF